VSRLGQIIIRAVTRAARRYLVGPQQQWSFEPPPAGWIPPQVEQTSLYLHVPFCRHNCPYCPYTKVAYDPTLVEPYTRAALAEVDWWADRIGPAEISSIYIGGGTPTLVMDSVADVLAHMRKRFRLVGEICIEANPADIDQRTVHRLTQVEATLVSLGVQSFHTKNLRRLGRAYTPGDAERALSLLSASPFRSVNVDLMFALPGQTAAEVTTDLARAAELGADQITVYPLFTFPFAAVGEYLRLMSLRMPDLRLRRTHYRAISRWCAAHDFERVSVWGFRRGSVPRYSSVTRDGYIGVGPGAGSHLPDGFTLNTFDFASWSSTLEDRRSPIALRMPFTRAMSGWWWLYWRFYDTRFSLEGMNGVLGEQRRKARRWLRVFELARLAIRSGEDLELTERGAFWLHLAQNYFALNYVNTLWTKARREAWPEAIAI
jgi:coproporphyrinogen III oxidase-like Fe-S oxidoreductase